MTRRGGGGRGAAGYGGRALQCLLAPTKRDGRTFFFFLTHRRRRQGLGLLVVLVVLVDLTLLMMTIANDRVNGMRHAGASAWGE